MRGYKSYDGNIVCPEDIVGKHFHEDGPIKFHHHGLHFCERLEDTLRYSGGISNPNILVAEVEASNELDEGEDTYYDFYDMYATSDLDVIRIIPREEIIAMYLDMYPSFRTQRFLSSYILHDDEIPLFKEKFKDSDRDLFMIEKYQGDGPYAYQKVKK